MDILTGLLGLVIGAITAWQLTWGHAVAELSQQRRRLEERIGYWQGEVEQARTGAAQVAERTEAWLAGCQQGHADLLSLARALAQPTSLADDDTTAA